MKAGGWTLTSKSMQIVRNRCSSSPFIKWNHKDERDCQNISTVISIISCIYWERCPYQALCICSERTTRWVHFSLRRFVEEKITILRGWEPPPSHEAGCSWDAKSMLSLPDSNCTSFVCPSGPFLYPSLSFPKSLITQVEFGQQSSAKIRGEEKVRVVTLGTLSQLASWGM